MSSTLIAIKELISIHLDQYEELINYNPDQALIELKYLLNELELIRDDIAALLIKAEDEKKELDLICY